MLQLVGFVAVAWGAGLVKQTSRVFAQTRGALNDLFDPDLDEKTKERRMRRHAVVLFGLFGLLVFIGAAAVALPVGLVWLAEQFGWLSLEGALVASLTWPFLKAVSVLGCGTW